MGRKWEKTRRNTAWAAALLALALSGCGASASDSREEIAEQDVYAENAYDTGDIYENAVPSAGQSSAQAEEEGAVEGTSAPDISASDTSEQDGSGQKDGEESRTGRKLIKNAYLSVETEDYPSLIVTVTDRVEELGGYIERYEAYNEDQAGARSASLTVRIPAEKLDSFIDQVGEVSNITSREESVEDVTLQYVDMESHKRMLEEEQERLLALLEQAETLEDIIAIEGRLTEVRYQLESMEAQLRTIDNQVAYSTVNLSVTEVERYTPPVEKGTWERISTGFTENVFRVGRGIREFFIGFVISLPILLTLAAVLLVILLAVRLFLRQAEKRNAARRQKAMEAGLAHRAADRGAPPYGRGLPPAPGGNPPPRQGMDGPSAQGQNIPFVQKPSQSGNVSCTPGENVPPAPDAVETPQPRRK